MQSWNAIDNDRVIQYIITKDFSSAAEAIGQQLPPDEGTWGLYLVLCDRAILEDFTPEWSETDASRIRLRKNVLKGEVWKQLSSSWGPEVAPPTLVKLCLKISARNQSDSVPMVEYMEDYIARLQQDESIDKKVIADLVQSFITTGLVEQSQDFAYARELAKGAIFSHDPSQQEQLLLKIDYAEREVIEAQKRIIEEQERRIEEANRIQQEELANNEMLKQQTEDVNHDNVSTSNEASTDEVPSKVPSRDVSRDEFSLKKVWRGWLHDIVRGRGVYNALLLIALIFTVMRNRRLKRGLRNKAIQLYYAAKAGIAMALQVTYL